MLFFFQAEDGIRDLVRSRGLGDVYKRQHLFEVGAGGGLPGFGSRINLVAHDGQRIAPAVLRCRTQCQPAVAVGVHAVSYTHLTLPTSDLV